MDNRVDVDFFEQALDSEGLSDVEVIHYTEPAEMREVIGVRTTIDGEKFGLNHAITYREMDEIDDMKQHIATLAAQTAHDLNGYLTERIEWGEKCVQLDLKQDYSATCFRCGAEVSLDDLQTTAVRMAESAVPQPTLTDPRKLPMAKIRMTLQALLRDKCDPMCPSRKT